MAISVLKTMCLATMGLTGINLSVQEVAESLSPQKYVQVITQPCEPDTLPCLPDTVFVTKTSYLVRHICKHDITVLRDTVHDTVRLRQDMERHLIIREEK